MNFVIEKIKTVVVFLIAYNTMIEALAKGHHALQKNGGE